MTKGTEIRDKIFAASKLLHEISEDLSKPIEWDGIDTVYLSDKIVGNVENVTKHIKGQLKHRKA